MDGNKICPMCGAVLLPWMLMIVGGKPYLARPCIKDCGYIEGDELIPPNEGRGEYTGE